MAKILGEPISNARQSIAMTIAEQLRNEGMREKLLEAIEMGFSLRFGDEGLKRMSGIRWLRKTERLRAIAKTIHTAKDLAEFERRI